MTNLTRMLLGYVCLVTSASAFAAGQTSTNYTMVRDTLNNGGGEMVSTNYRMTSAVGDAVATGSITSVAYRLDSGFLAHVTVSPGLLTLLSVISKKIHGSTPFSLAIDHTQLITGNVTVEPRAIGTGHTLIFHFDSPVTSAGAVTALDGLNATAGTAAVSLPGNGDVQVTLTNVNDTRRVKVTLTGLNTSGAASASLGFLLGDVNGNRSVNVTDINAIKSRSGSVVDATNFLFDLNASGVINASDIATVKARSSNALANQ